MSNPPERQNVEPSFDDTRADLAELGIELESPEQARDAFQLLVEKTIGYDVESEHEYRMTEVVSLFAALRRQTAEASRPEARRPPDKTYGTEELHRDLRALGVSTKTSESARDGTKNLVEAVLGERLLSKHESRTEVVRVMAMLLANGIEHLEEAIASLREDDEDEDEDEEPPLSESATTATVAATRTVPASGGHVHTARLVNDGDWTKLAQLEQVASHMARVLVGSKDHERQDAVNVALDNYSEWCVANGMSAPRR